MIGSMGKPPKLSWSGAGALSTLFTIGLCYIAKIGSSRAGVMCGEAFMMHWSHLEKAALSLQSVHS